MEEDSSSLEFHDVEDSPTKKSVPATPPPAAKKNKFRTLTLRRKKTSVPEEVIDTSQKSATLPQKKRKGSLTQLLSFGKSKKKEEPYETVDWKGSCETLNEIVGASCVNKKTLAAAGSSEVEVSRETLCEDLEVSPGRALRLRNTLRASSVIELNLDSKITSSETADEGSTDSFKSADSPVLCNTGKGPAVDSAQQGCLYSEPDSDCLTESSFAVFAESQFLKEFTAPKPKKRSLWKRFISREKVVVYSKTPSNLLDTHVDGAMSQNQAGIRKERARGRGAAPTKKEENLEKQASSPSTSIPQGSLTPPPQPASPVDEDTLRKSAAIGSQILQQKKDQVKRISGDHQKKKEEEEVEKGKEEGKLVSSDQQKKEDEKLASGNQKKEEEGKRVSGDELRKQLTEGLKNGSGKSKDAAVKAQLSEITQGAAKSSAAETRSFIEKERKSKEESKEKQEEENAKLTRESKNKSVSQIDTPVSTTSQEKQEMPPTESKKEHLYKILVIGELGTGKTSIIKRYVHQFFSQHYRATIGVDFALKVLNWDENSIIRLQLWDIAGQERFGNMTRVYYKEAVGAFIVFDVTRAATFDAVQKWKQDLDSKVQLSDGSPIPCILLANKCDQPKEGVVNNKNKMDEYCRENGFAGWFETSAKENINIEEAAKALVLKILQNDRLIRTGERSQDGERIALDGGSDATPSKSCSC